MLGAAGNLEFETAARLRDEIKRLRETELAVADDPLARQQAIEDRAGAFRGGLARKPTLDEMGARGEVPVGGGKASRVKGPAGLSPRSLARKPTLDEMTVGRTEKPLGGPAPKKPGDTAVPGLVARGRIGTGSYEDPVEERRRKGRTKKTGRPSH
jgi:excinuclease ABC subunit B